MHRLTFEQGERSLRKVLCLGAHSDDIEIGCGGTILKILGSNPDLSVSWVVFSSDSARAEEARRSADRFLKGAGSKEIILQEFRESFFPYDGGPIKEFFESLKRISPDLICTHYRNDLHQDHRLISDLTWNTFRDHLILEYEVPKYDGDLGTPNMYVTLDEATTRRKTRIILDCFPSQRDKRWFTEDAFLAMMRLRGIESNSPSRYAEGFYCRKLVL